MHTIAELLVTTTGDTISWLVESGWVLRRYCDDSPPGAVARHREEDSSMVLIRPNLSCHTC